MAELLERILSRIAATPLLEERGELFAELGSYAARIGDGALSAESISKARAAVPFGQSSRVAVAVMLAEGISLYFQNLSDSARDRIQRAYIVGQSVRLPKWSDLSAAWFAHVELNRSQYASMSNLLIGAFKHEEMQCPEVLTRAGIVLGDAYMLAQRVTEAKGWYEIARRNACSLGDRASIGALMHNRAAYAISGVRVCQYIGDFRASEEDLRSLVLEIDSSAAYHYIAGLRSLSHLTDLFRGRILLMMRDYRKALELLHPLSEGVRSLEHRAARSPVDGDLLLCAVGCGDNELAERLLQNWNPHEVAALDSDDQVIVLGTVMEAAQAIRDMTLMESTFELFREAQSRYRTEMIQLNDALNALTDAGVYDLAYRATSGMRSLVQ